MEKLQRLFLSSILCMTLWSCTDKLKESQEVLEFGKHSQGSYWSLNALSKAIELDSTNAEAWRELSIPYLKRGIPDKWNLYMEQAVKYDAETWQGYRGYNYLWFYRDYKKAIADFNATDSITPNFIDAPQGHSVDYWRGIAYLGLKDYKNSIAYFDKHIQKETEESGEDWVEINAFLYRGIAHYEAGNLNEALNNFDDLLRLFRNISADAKYYKALVLKAKGDLETAKTYTLSAIEDYNLGYYNNRPYVEALRQIYPEDLENLLNSLN